MSGYAKRLIATAVGLLLFLFLTTGCGQQDEITLDASDDGSQVALDVDQELVIRLESNPTTGYSWAVHDVDETVLRQVGDAEYEAEVSELVGSGGWESLRFAAVSAGQTTLQLFYRRPFEEEAAPEQTFTVAVTVR